MRLPVSALVPGLLWLAACATPTNELPTLPASSAKIEPDKTYAVVTMEDEDTYVGLLGFCFDDGSGSYTTMATNLPVVACSEPAPSFVAGGADWHVLAGDRHRLSDGTLFRFLEVAQQRELSISSLTTELQSGRYVLAGRQGDGVGYVFAGRLEAHDVDFSGSPVFYVGHMRANSRGPSWRDPGDLKDRLSAEVPGLDPTRVVVAPPTVVRVDCDGSRLSRYPKTCRIIGGE